MVWRSNFLGDGSKELAQGEHRYCECKARAGARSLCRQLPWDC